MYVTICGKELPKSKYTSFEELTPTLLREFVEKIVLHKSEAFMVNIHPHFTALFSHSSVPER